MNFKKLLFVAILIFLPLKSTFFSYDGDLRKKIGQMIIVGFTLIDADSVIMEIENGNVGGVILFAYNVQNPAQLNALTSQLQNSSEIPLFIAIDQEGGKVARLNQTNGYESTPTAHQLGTIWNNEDSTRFYAEKIAMWLKEGGINLDLAPVVDVNVNPLSPAIGKKERSFSANPDSVFYHASIFIEELNKKKIIGALKHFPGHGSAIGDSHNGFTDVTETWINEELIPFSLFSQNGYEDMVMTAHIYNERWDTVPATLSKRMITDILKDSLGFKGVVITDAMSMGAITSNYSFEGAIVHAINAGCDILLYTSLKKDGRFLAEQVIDIIEEKITEGAISIDRIEESYQKIISLKEARLNSAPFDKIIIPDNFGLFVFPNPFNAAAKIQITLNENSFGSVILYDPLGRMVKEIYSGDFIKGTNLIDLNGSDLATGAYFITARGNFGAKTFKIIVLK